jgi:SAM-dependent methyltransferase
MSILDLGVGGGRTTPYLSEIASHYVGIDYAEEMIRVCRTKFPNLQFDVTDASDLSGFADASFDAVIFSFNGIDYLAPDEKREVCLRECYRVLKKGGIFIFSTHNPRSLFLNLQWDKQRLRVLAANIAGNHRVLSSFVLGALTCGRFGLALFRSFLGAMSRVRRRILTRAFWLGAGYLLDPSHGGLVTHGAVPGKVTAELAGLRFRLLNVLPEDYPRNSYIYSTRWYYYAFSKE